MKKLITPLLLVPAALAHPGIAHAHPHGSGLGLTGTVLLISGLALLAGGAVYVSLRTKKKYASAR